jgi:hypothetical protein
MILFTWAILCRFSPEGPEAEVKFHSLSSLMRPKAPEDWRSPKPGGVPGGLGGRASVLDCGDGVFAVAALEGVRG